MLYAAAVFRGRSKKGMAYMLYAAAETKRTRFIMLYAALERGLGILCCMPRWAQTKPDHHHDLQHCHSHPDYDH